MKPDPLQINANATHQGILAGVVAQTTGPVIELGVGHYSTAMLHFMCKHRPLLSIENDIDWHNFYAAPFRNGTHDFYYAKNMTYVEALNTDKYKPLFWDVAFIDHSPEQQRRDTVEEMRKRAKFIVVHDAEPEAVIYNWGNLFETFKYKYYWNFYGNGTMAVSDFEPIEME